MDLKPVRNELDKIDSVIKYLLVLRMSLIPIVTQIKLENNLELFQPKREEQIYNNIKSFSEKTGINNELLKGIYELIISEAISMEESQSLSLKNDIENSKLKENLKVTDEILERYKELDKILEIDIPKIVSEISQILPDKKLLEIFTGILERKIYEL